MTKLETKNITKKYGDKSIIENISIKLHKNECVALLGISGVGKTTMFNILSGISRPDKGKVLLDNEDITGVPGNIGYMLQKDLLLPYRTIADNVALPLTIKGKSKIEAREVVSQYFEEFGLKGTEEKYPSQLSGGMRQRAALLRTYMFESGVILLDEPFSSLDAITRNTMHKWYLHIINNHKKSTIFITHDIDEAILLANRIYILAGSPGEIIAEIDVGNDALVVPKKEDFNLSKEFLEYKRRILELME